MHHRTLSTCKPLLLMSNNIIGTTQYGSGGRIFYLPEKMMLLRSLKISAVEMTLPKAPLMLKTMDKYQDKEVYNNKTATKTNTKEEILQKSTTGEITIKNKIVNNNDIEPTNSVTPYPALLEYTISSAKSPEELLNMTRNSTLLLKHASLILSRLGQLSLKDESITFQSLSNDARFLQVCNLVQRGNYSQNPHSLFLVIHGLQSLKTPKFSELFNTLSAELKWAMRRCPVRFLARAIELFSSNGKEHTYKKKPIKISGTENDGEMGEILELAIENLQRRWVEVASGNDFIAVFKVFQFLDNETKEKLEDRAIQLVQEFSAPEIRKIFVGLAAVKIRPTPLLRALSYHLSKSEERANAKDLIELTYSLNELTFAEPLVMEKICTDLCSEISNVDNSAVISSLVTSIGRMRFKHKGLMQILDEWIMSHLDNLRPFDCAAWLLTCAVLNFHSSQKKQFCTKANSLLSLKNSSSQIEWINIVHALVVLNEYSESQLASALEPAVIKNIDSLGPKTLKTKIKLLNINAIAKSKQGYKGSILDTKTETNWTSTCLTASDAKLSTIVLESLGNFLPTEKYLKLNQKLDAGVFVDAICLFNNKLEPLPVTTEFKKNDCLRVAVIVDGYSSLCLGMKEATGSTVLNRKLLKLEGYQVISVPYTEFNASDKLLRRVKYLEQKIKSLAMNDSEKMSNR